MMSTARKLLSPETSTPRRLGIVSAPPLPSGPYRGSALASSSLSSTSRTSRTSRARSSDLDLSLGERPTRAREFVLVFGISSESLHDTTETLVLAGYSPVSTVDPDEAIADMHRFAFDALVLAARITPTIRERMVGAYRALRPRGKVIEFDGAPRRLVESVNRALAG